jgi:formamidopyrimidine-DNA glycosylase
MPELPDVTVYVEALEKRTVGQPLRALRLGSPFVLRSVDPPISELVGRTVRRVERLGKRIVFELDEDRFIVIHLMIAGRFRWGDPGMKLPGKLGLAAFDFPSGTLVLTEASSKKRASLHLVRGREGLEAFRRGGLEVLEATRAQFEEALTRENHTLKRSLTDPRLFSGIGNAYSDEILHAAQLSPVRLSQKLEPAEVKRLFDATKKTLLAWTKTLREEAGDGFPEKVTAFRPGMAVHGRFRQPCPRCGAPVQRIAYAENETNYCARCQTEGRLLADRSLSRLLKDDWPRTLEELEERRPLSNRGEGDKQPSKPTPPRRRGS